MAISPAILFNLDLLHKIYMTSKNIVQCYIQLKSIEDLHWDSTLDTYNIVGSCFFIIFAREALQYSYQIENAWLFLDTQKLWYRSPAYQKAVPGHLRVRYLPQDVIRRIGSYKLIGINIQIFACYQTPEQLATRVSGVRWRPRVGLSYNHEYVI